MSAISPTIVTRCDKGQPLTPFEIDKNFTNIKDSIDQLCAVVDSLSTGLGGDLTALETRMTAAETAIIVNAGDTAQNALDISINTGAIAVNVSDITAANIQIATNAVNISANTTSISSNTAAISVNATNIGINATDISTNVADILTNTTDITTINVTLSALSTTVSTNTTDIATNSGLISTNIIDIATNVTDIAANLAAILVNATDINEIGKLTEVAPALVAFQSGAGTNASFPSADTFNLNTLVGVPLVAASVRLEIRTEISSDGSTANEGYMKVNGGGKMGRCLTGIGTENIAANDREVWVDTRGGVVASFNISLIFEILLSGTHASVAASKTEIFVTGYRIP